LANISRGFQHFRSRYVSAITSQTQSNLPMFRWTDSSSFTLMDGVGNTAVPFGRDRSDWVQGAFRYSAAGHSHWTSKPGPDWNRRNWCAHVCPYFPTETDHLRVRFRKDGVLRNTYACLYLSTCAIIRRQPSSWSFRSYSSSYSRVGPANRDRSAKVR
jgi:hypothetical protein